MKRILLLAALLAACGGPARTVMVNGREVNYDDAANDVLRRGKQALEAGRTDEALKVFRDVIERFGQSAAADEARLREGQALARAGRLQEAQAKLTGLLEKHPNTSFKKEGESITLADFKTGDHVFGPGEVKDGTFVAAKLMLGDMHRMRGGPEGSHGPDQK